MKIAIFGLGYVGFTATCCIASQGHSVIGVDISDSKVAKILSGIAPISEPHVEAMLRDGLAAGKISATVTAQGSLDDCDIAMVCVGTPSAPDGSHDMSYIISVTRQIAQAITPDRQHPLTVVYRSTMRPGAMEYIVQPIFEAELGDAMPRAVELVYNPEFLREAHAVADYFAPPKIVIGTYEGNGSCALDQLYADITAPRFNVGFREAEITKFIDNTWHALKVAFGNEIGRICLGANIDAASAHAIFVVDTKLNISSHYLRPGGAFGGSCLPKDVRALQRLSAESGAHTHLIDSLLPSNDAHKRCLFDRVEAGLSPGDTVLLVGLAFKAHTDDLRESPNVDLARMLLQAGYAVSIYDPSINRTMLTGSNLGYIYAHIPSFASLMIDRAEAEGGSFARAVICNETAADLDLSRHQLVDISKL